MYSYGCALIISFLNYFKIILALFLLYQFIILRKQASRKYVRKYRERKILKKVISLDPNI